MRLPRVRLTTRRLMIVVAILAVLIATPIVVIREIGKAMNEFYGPGGTLERRGNSVR